MNNEDEDFKEVKLCSKHAAFVRHRPNEGYFIHYATQNERCQQAVERQKIPVDDQFAAAVDQIIDCYPAYCEVTKLPGYEENAEGLFEFLGELA